MEDLREKAVEKLKAEKENAKNGSAERILDNLIATVQESPALAEDVMQEHKTFEKCFAFIRELARKKAVNNCAMVEDTEVYEWAQDYYHKDDKALEEEKKKKEEERKKRNEDARKNAQKRNEKVRKADTGRKPEVKKPETAKPSKPAVKGQIDGQLSLFDLMGGE